MDVNHILPEILMQKLEPAEDSTMQSSSEANIDEAFRDMFKELM